MLFRVRRYRVIAFATVTFLYVFYTLVCQSTRHTYPKAQGSYAQPLAPHSSSPPSDSSYDSYGSPHNQYIPTPIDPAAPVASADGANDADDTAYVPANDSVDAPLNNPSNAPADETADAPTGGVGDVADATDTESSSFTASQFAVHWTKMPEHFPVPEKSLILLPTGNPKAIPRIQHRFDDASAEPDTVRKEREERLATVRREMVHAWNGYRTYAWAHDELMPISKSSRDPFCGWAASLVDSLDTLWIMGLHDDFDKAYAAVQQIDFTTTPRAQIPVFETTIRYLGGLLAAYDVSGGHSGKYPALLTKAVELGNILMDVFDTPNRMPVLYFSWQPAFTSQRRIASTASSVAEIGSLTMEFTRLAQLTGHSKYYDAVARIVDKFEDWQNSGTTAIPGIFPDPFDASGCNQTAALELEYASQAAKAQAAADAAKADIDKTPVGYQPKQPASSPMQNQNEVDATKHMPPDLEFRVNPSSQPSEPLKGELHDVLKRATLPAPLAADGEPIDTSCIPMNFTASSSSYNSYSMGGSQDSTYEYFSKQYLLLGGLVPKYQAMHEKVADAVTQHLLYRPMIPDETRNILFSAKVSFSEAGGGRLEIERDYEVTHLTCFLGGMFAMGGRIFDRPNDIEIGSKLADGCVWAYETMPTGIMPENSFVLPCADLNDCPWNETAWHEALDPSTSWRESQMAQYEADHREWETKKEAALQEQRRLQKDLARIAEEEDAELAVSNSASGAGTAAGDSAPSETAGSSSSDASAHTPIGKRGAVDGDDDLSAAATAATADQDVQPRRGDLSLDAAAVDAKNGDASVGEAVYDESRAIKGPARTKQKPLVNVEIPPEPKRPETHEEFVQTQIEQLRLPPGFVALKDQRYILRPEAIESVWYMYRITGDRKWQDKGWRMFEAVIAATRTEAGHTAVNGVAARVDKGESLEKSDSMESFWFSETLKYYYLLFAPPDVISLDEWVLNTEAHPFRRPLPGT